MNGVMQVIKFKPLLIYLLSFSLFGCATIQNTSQKAENIATKSHVDKTTTTKFKATRPNSVKLNANPKAPHKTIGEVYVSRYNIWGIKRQTGVINDLMQTQAAKAGGNAVTNIHMNKKYASGEVVKIEYHA